MKPRKVAISHLKLGDLVEVLWDDAYADSNWVTRDQIKWPQTDCRSVGYYMNHNDRTIMIMDSMFEDYKKPDGTVGGMKTIPRPMILGIYRHARTTRPASASSNRRGG